MHRPTILLVNKFYHDTGPAGGVGRYLVQEEQDLQAAGWQVVPFAIADECARPSPWDRFFPAARDYTRPRFGAGAAADALSLIWNREAARNLERLLAEVRPDVAHVHNIYHHLSPSILTVLRRHRVPVVMTLHDLRLLCPAIHMLRQGEICERCRGGHFHQAVLGRCVKGSRTASALAAVETFHQRSRRLYEIGVQTFLCPSRFILDKYAQWGFPRHKLVHLPNFVDLEQWRPEALGAAGTRDSYLYFGRISPEKGLATLVRAQALWEQGYAAGTIAEAPLQLLIAGEGPGLAELQAQLDSLHLATVSLLGPLTPDRIRGVMGRARFAVLPTECYENSPMAALEALACGLPLVGTDLGGIPELIADGVTGILVAPRDPQALLAGLRRAAALGPAAGAAAAAWARTHADRRQHMAALQQILQGALSP